MAQVGTYYPKLRTEAQKDNFEKQYIYLKVIGNSKASNSPLLLFLTTARV